YEPTKDGESPLSLIDDWVNVPCPICGKMAKRETDTMPGWAGSSWYFLRFCDPNNENEFASQNSLKSWLPVDLYNGGNEHTTRHLLYARFWAKFFYDIGILPVNEPFKKRISQGIILGSNGIKMSKSLGNVVDPREVISAYGADSLRLWEAFIGDYADTVAWNDEGVKSCYKFLNRIWNLQDLLIEGDAISKNLSYQFNFTIKKYDQDMGNNKFNTIVSGLMILTNEIYKVGEINKEEYKILLTLLNPFAPHITEEIWTNQKFSPTMQNAKWPKCDESALILDELKIPIQINGKLRGIVLVDKNESAEGILTLAKNDPTISKHLEGNTIKKCIYINGKIFNIII
ncbi:MAG: class I tRNA ligase family protein, partial [Clostridia bacterium]